MKKELKKTFLFIILAALFLGPGCEKGTNTWGHLNNPISEEILRSISGRVVTDENSLKTTSIRENTLSAVVPLANADVWLEEKPEIRTRSDSNGNFNLTDIPDGSYHIICRFISVADRQFKTRSAATNFNGSPINAGDFAVAPARNFITGRLTSSQGQPIVGAILSLWGETFQTDSDGKFFSPPVTDGIVTATIRIISAPGFRTFEFPAFFQSPGNNELELSMVSNYDSRFAPLIQLISDKTAVARKEQISIEMSIYDPDEPLQTNQHIKWQASHGLLEISPDKLSAKWTAPDDNVSVTISVSVTDSSGLTGKNSLTIQSGTGGTGNRRPQISNLKVASASEDIEIIFDLLDEENDGINITMSFSTDNGATYTATRNFIGAGDDITPAIARKLTWLPGADLSSLNNPVIIKLEAADKIGTSTPAISHPFYLDYTNIAPNNAPSGLQVTFSDGRGIITWQNTTGASGYRLYWSETSQITRDSTGSFSATQSPFYHENLAHDKTYYYRISAINKWGESPLSDETFGKTDFLPPAVVSLFPEDGSYGIATSTWLEIELSESVTAGDGNITIYNPDGSIFAEIPATSNQVTVNQNIIQIKPIMSLESAAEYYILIDAKAFKDTSGNSFPGINTPTAWNFRTMFEFNESLQWNHQIINASAAWLYATGKGIKVAVIDTGIDSQHPDLADRIVSGRDLVNDGQYLQDGLGHGTHVAGIIAARGNNSGVIGIAPGASLHIIKVFSMTGSGPTADMIVTAIQDSVNSGARIINMSIGTKIFNAAYEDAASQARANGALIFAAAGNDNSSQLRYLAACPSVVSVGATTLTDQRFSLSNFSADLDFSAPGEQILSTLPSSGFGQISGTSMASPHVAAVAALIWEKNPDFSADDIINALVNSAVDLGAPGRDEYYGFGRIDALRAVIYQPTHASIRASALVHSRADQILLSDFSATNFAKGQLIIKLAENADLSEILRDCNLENSGIKVIKTLGSSSLLLVSVPGGHEKTIGTTLQNHREVKYAELNAIMSFE